MVVGRKLGDYLDCKDFLFYNDYEEWSNGEDFYNFIFPNCESKGEMNKDFSKPNAVFLYKDLKTTLNDTDKPALKRRIMLKDTWGDDYAEFVLENDLTLCSGLSYRGRHNDLAHAQQMNALIFDLDGVGLKEITAFFEVVKYCEKNEPNKYFWPIPRPTFVVLSGVGLHVYYVFDKPIDLFPNIKLQLKAYKYALTFNIWRYKETSKEKETQYQSINQSFRMVGSINEKHGNKIIAFKTGDRVSLEYMNQYVKEDKRVDILKRLRPSKHNLAEAKLKFPKWYERVIIQGQTSERKKWCIKRDVYEWWKKRCKEPKGGHRYFFMMCMAIYAYKCDVSKQELEKDMLEVFEKLKDIPHTNPLTKRDVHSALESYDKGMACFKIKDIEILTALRIDRNRRNYQTQENHLEIARAIRDVKQSRQGKTWNNKDGRPKNSGTKQLLIQEWRIQNPQGKKIACHRELGLSRPTIDKWWD